MKRCKHEKQYSNVNVICTKDGSLRHKARCRYGNCPKRKETLLYRFHKKFIEG